MKGLEQRHSQLPNAWTRPQGPRTHISLLTDSCTQPSMHLIYVYMEKGQWRAELGIVSICVGGCAYVHDGEQRFIKLLSLLTNLCKSS